MTMSEKEIKSSGSSGVIPAESELGQVSQEKNLTITAADDKALEFIHEHGASGPLSPEDNKRILRKIDMHLLPMVLNIFYGGDQVEALF